MTAPLDGRNAIVTGGSRGIGRAIALELGREGAVPAPFAAQCRELWAAASAMRGPAQDHTAVAKLPEALAGMELKAKT